MPVFINFIVNGNLKSINFLMILLIRRITIIDFCIMALYPARLINSILPVYFWRFYRILCVHTSSVNNNFTSWLPKFIILSKASNTMFKLTIKVINFIRKKFKKQYSIWVHFPFQTQIQILPLCSRPLAGITERQQELRIW